MVALHLKKKKNYEEWCSMCVRGKSLYQKMKSNI